MFWAVPWPDDKYSEEVYCNNCEELVEIRSNDFMAKKKNISGRGWRQVKYSELEDLGVVWNSGFGYFPRDSDVRCGCEENPIVQSKDNSHLYTKQSSAFRMREHNWAGAIKIVHAGRDVRVFPDEYNRTNPDKMRLTLEAYELVHEDAPLAEVAKRILETEEKVLYEFALVEGADENLAMAIATGKNISEDEIEPDEFPAIGWYKLIPEYQGVFGNG